MGRLERGAFTKSFLCLVAMATQSAKCSVIYNSAAAAYHIEGLTQDESNMLVNALKAVSEFRKTYPLFFQMDCTGLFLSAFNGDVKLLFSVIDKIHPGEYRYMSRNLSYSFYLDRKNSSSYGLYLQNADYIVMDFSLAGINKNSNIISFQAVLLNSDG